MPYIKQDDRVHFEDAINLAVNRLQQRDFNPGHLNFVLSQIVWKMLGKNDDYRQLSAIGGVLSDMRDEYFRRVMAPYEDGKIATNGDLERGPKLYNTDPLYNAAEDPAIRSALQRAVNGE